MGKRVLVLLSLSPMLLAAGAPATPRPLSDKVLQHAADLALPSIVNVVQYITGTVIDTTDGSVHGPYNSAYEGTGFFISSDGYIVTAAHLAAPTGDTLKDELVDTYIDDIYNCDPSTTADACQSVQDLHHDRVAPHVQIKSDTIDLQVFTQDMSPLGDGMPATLISSSPTSEQDNAVIKIDGSNEPVLLLGNSDGVNISTSMVVVGYPAADQSNGPTLVPTVTTGDVVDKLKGADSGFQNIGATADLIQTSAPISQGNSGGPAVQPDGSVIGIVSFGDTFANNYLIASNDVSADVSQTAGIKNQLGPIDTLYRQGLDAYDRGDYTQAKQLFEQCSTMNTVQIYCKSMSAAAANGGGKTTASSSDTTGWDTVIATFFITLFSAIIVTLVRRRNRTVLTPVPSISYRFGPFSSPYAAPQSPYGAYATQYSAYPPPPPPPAYPAYGQFLLPQYAPPLPPMPQTMYFPQPPPLPPAEREMYRVPQHATEPLPPPLAPPPAPPPAPAMPG